MNSFSLRRLCFRLAILVPALVFAFLQGCMDRHSVLLDKYEWKFAETKVDFDGDGVAGRLFVDTKAPDWNFDSWIVVEDSGRQLLKQPRRYLDSTLRTHAAVIKDSGNARLIIYDHILDGRPPRSRVFTYNGATEMVEVPQQKLDQDVIAALASTDDGGTFRLWIIAQFVKLSIISYFLVLILCLRWCRLQRRNCF